MKAIACRFLHIRSHSVGTAGWNTCMPVFWVDEKHLEFSDKDKSMALKWAVA